jgi:hypothetical protein
MKQFRPKFTDKKIKTVKYNLMNIGFHCISVQ